MRLHADGREPIGRRRHRATPTPGLAAATYYYKVDRRGRRRQHRRRVGARRSSPSRRRARPASSPPTASTRAPARRPSTSPATATPARSASTLWSTAGKFGNALSFNGTDARVNVPDSASLDLTTGHDDGGLGQAGRAQRLEHRRLQGAHRQLRLRRSTRTPTPTGRPAHDLHRPPTTSSRGTVALPVGRLDAPRRDLRRRPRSRSTSTARRSPSMAATGSIAASTGAAADRRQRDLGRVLQRPDRRGPRLQPRADRAPRSRPTWTAASRRTRRRRR